MTSENSPQAEKIKDSVIKRYGSIAQQGGTCCGSGPSCCGTANTAKEKDREDAASRDASNVALKLGYSEDDLAGVPEGSNLGLGCGNPQAIAELKPGEVVLDLGSGAGFDCFIAARAVGPTGRVIGVDMTPDMVLRARQKAREGGFANVEFRLGEIEHLPVADQSVDVVISNCVINLSPDKPAVFREAFRVLKPGGRLAVSDVVAVRPLPEEWKRDLDQHTGCISGASQVHEIEKMLADAGFVEVKVEIDEKSADVVRDWQPGANLEQYVRSARISAKKPSCCCT